MSLPRLQFGGSTALTTKAKKLLAPPGYVAEPEPLPAVSARLQAGKEAAAWKLSMQPGMALFQTAFMLWMVGSGIQIFSIYATYNALATPIKGLFSVNDVFKHFEEKDGINLFLPKLVFCSLQVLGLGVGLYKCSTMGLLPLTSADWTHYIPKKVPMESSWLTV